MSHPLQAMVVECHQYMTFNSIHFCEDYLSQHGFPKRWGKYHLSSVIHCGTNRLMSCLFLTSGHAMQVFLLVSLWTTQVSNSMRVQLGFRALSLLILVHKGKYSFATVGLVW